LFPATGSCGGFAPVRCSQSNASIVITFRSKSSFSPDEEACDVRVSLRVVQIAEVVIPDVVDENDRLLARAGRVGRNPPQRRERDLVRPVAVAVHPKTVRGTAVATQSSTWLLTPRSVYCFR
jgi:hypothetical protein